MAKQTILTEIDTGEVMYPQTLASLVKTADGGNVDEGLEKAKFALFVDMWNDIWSIECRDEPDNKTQMLTLGKYDIENAPDKSRPFRAYDDCWLSYEEALAVVDEYKWSTAINGMRGCLQAGKAKVAVPFVFGAHSMNMDLSSLSVYNNHIEEMGFYCGTEYTPGYTISNLYAAFHSTRSKLRKIHGYLPVKKGCSFNNWIGMAYLMERFHLRGLADSMSVADCPLLNLDTFSYMVAHAANTTPITVTVHPDVYAKLTGDTTNAAAALTEEELAQWMALVEVAAAKNITFATA